ncbi:DUF4870 domain-containing protein [Bacillus sp. REN10]|uniref:DUF4870 domain-containing protein n=1 Tax=Bacillus sp. REN10 TaxID=2782541 RepID=UPI00193BAEBB|nr:DUF4870 domain-containing protein [Bacillus sp. REN10]
MRASQVLSSLCYFSIFFAPFLFPVVVYFVADEEVKAHAKSAFWSHIIPFIVLVVGMILSGVLGIGAQEEMAVGIGIVVTYGIFVLIGLYFFIWNIVKGIKVLLGD